MKVCCRSADPKSRAALQGGLGIYYPSTWLCKDLHAEGEVLRLLPQWASPLLPIHLISPRERGDAAKLRAFSDQVAEQLGAPWPTEPAAHAQSGA